MKPDEIQQNNEAADLIRQKLNNLYGTEPSARVESAEVAEIKPSNRSKHQQFMSDLNSSGKSQPEIEAAWHEYYSALSDEDKHEVWKEFYGANKQINQSSRPTAAAHPAVEQNPTPYKRPRVSARPSIMPTAGFSGYVEPVALPQQPPKKRARRDTKTVAEIKQQLLSTVKNRQKLNAKRHVQSLIFGLGVGSLVMLVLLFGFFNERFIAPFITPSRSVSSTPIIIDEGGTDAADPNPKVIIPKINVEIPVVYDEPSIEEAAVQKALEKGVIHYATTPLPGEKGNVVIFGHSSNNIFNQGQFKFAFVLLSRLEIGDTFYLTREGKRYAYRIYETKIVSPSQVEVLGPASKPDSATLITCDPPGTSLNRLVVIGEQISPDPNVNTASTAPTESELPKIVPSNAPTLWDRLTGWL